MTQICVDSNLSINCANGLSKARAEAIKSFVAKCGVDTDRVYAVGFAGTRRLSDDITEEKGAVNADTICVCDANTGNPKTVPLPQVLPCRQREPFGNGTLGRCNVIREVYWNNTVPGEVAIMDSGCVRSVVGKEWLKNWTSLPPKLRNRRCP